MKKCSKDLGLLFLRLSIGALMLFSHGLPKIQKMSQMAAHFPDPLGIGSQFSLYLAILGEVVCSILIMGGFLTRWAALGLTITMLTIIFGVHINDPWNKIEFAVLFLIPYLTILISGAGAYSIDAKIYRRSNSAIVEKFFRP